MKKSILNIGKALNKVEQKSINGGGAHAGGDECANDGVCFDRCYDTYGGHPYNPSFQNCISACPGPCFA